MFATVYRSSSVLALPHCTYYNTRKHTCSLQYNLGKNTMSTPYETWIQFNSRERKSCQNMHHLSLSGADSSHFNCYVSSTFQGACEGVPLPWKRSVPTTEFPNSLDNFQPLYIFFLFFFFIFFIYFYRTSQPSFIPLSKAPGINAESHT